MKDTMKDVFINKMIELQSIFKNIDIKNDCIKTMYGQYISDVLVEDKLLDAHIQLLQKYFTDESEWISYYIFDCEWGFEPLTITITYDKIYHTIKLDCLEKVWEAITLTKDSIKGS